MDLFPALGAAFLFALACNLDTLLLAMGYAARGVGLPRGGALVLALVTTAVTWLSLALGRTAAALLSPGAARALGGLCLVAMGLWLLLDSLCRLGQGEQASPGQAPGLWGCIPLAAALAVNNAGAGMAAGVAGLSLPACAAANLVLTLLALPLGGALGRGLVRRWLGRGALPLTGLLLLLLGLWEMAP